MRVPNILVLFCVLTATAVAAERYPYKASIAAVATPVLSGPGTEYYVTTTLKRGESVDVYYETENWCAIKPPEGSFSWISALYVEVEANGLGTVIADGLAARIGSDNTELCDTVQVKLKKGERVLVTGLRETPENSASPLWYKIAPPSGEFRWIRRDALAARRANEAKSPIQQVVYQSEAVVPAAVPSTGSSAKPPQQLLIPRLPPANPVRPRASAAEKTSPDVLPMPPLRDLMQDKMKQDKLASSRPDRVSLDTVTKELDPVAEAFSKAFEELKAEARIVMTRPTEDWVFQTLLDRGNELYEVAPSDADLEKVYHLVESLERTWAVRKEIAYRRQFRTGGLLTPPPSATPAPSTYSPAVQATMKALQGTALGPPDRPLSSNAVSSNTIEHGFKLRGFDVVGRLGEFENPPAGYPPYAVADEKQQILCLISPATGVELKEQVGKVVGINGILGFYEKANQPNRRHITVQEIVVFP